MKIPGIPIGNVQSHRAYINDQDMHILTAGNRKNPTVLLIHGLFEDALYWGSVIAVLQKRYFCIAPDLKGHGLTISSYYGDWTSIAFAKDMKAVLEYFEVDIPYAVCGHSWGGVVTQRFAHMYDAEKYVLCNTAAYPPKFFDITRFKESAEERLTEGVIRRNIQAMTESYVYIAMRDIVEYTSITSMETLIYMTDGLMSLANLPRNINIMIAFQNKNQSDFTTFDFREANKNIKRPITLIAATRDEIITNTESMELRDSLPTKSIHWLPTGHVATHNILFVQKLKELVEA